MTFAELRAHAKIIANRYVFSNSWRVRLPADIVDLAERYANEREIAATVEDAPPAGTGPKE